METSSKTAGIKIYVALFLTICLLPFVGMAWAPTQSTSSSAESVEAPQFILEDDSVNIDFLSQLGGYFEDHFAYRNLAIDMDARIKVTLFKTSPTDQVIVGDDGWLYYGGELADYQGLSPLTEREAKNIAHNLALVQGLTNARGATFVFTVAPNKSSLYPEHMPYYYLDEHDQSMELLKSCLKEEGVLYVDQFELFGAQSGELYSKSDSHWNYEGALLATNALLKACDKTSASAGSSFVDEAFFGDIEKMLYPLTAQPEAMPTLSTGPWDYKNSATSVEDSFIETGSKGKDTLLMFRDSFGDNLIPLMAPQFERAFFSKLVPYDMTQLETLKPDYLIVERAQRHVGFIAENPPVMLAPRVQIKATSSIESNTSIEVIKDGNFWVVRGWVDESCIGVDDDIFIQVKSADEVVSYVPFRVSGTVGTESNLTGPVDNAAGAAADGAGRLGSMRSKPGQNGEGHVSDYGFKSFFSATTLGESGYTITILVSKPGSNEVVAVASATF